MNILSGLQTPDSSAELLEGNMFSAKLLICEEQKETDCRKLLILRHLTLIMSLSCMLERNTIIVRDMSALLNHSGVGRRVIESGKNLIRWWMAGCPAQDKHKMEFYFDFYFKCSTNINVIYQAWTLLTKHYWSTLYKN